MSMNCMLMEEYKNDQRHYRGMQKFQLKTENIHHKWKISHHNKIKVTVKATEAVCGIQMSCYMCTFYQGPDILGKA